MARNRTPESLIRYGDYDPARRGEEYTTLIEGLNDQFTHALTLNDEHPGFEYLLYDNDPNTNSRNATLVLSSASYEDVVRYNAPKVEFTVPIDQEDDRISTLLLELDMANVVFWITNRTRKKPHIKVTFENFDRVLDNPIERRHGRHSRTEPTSYRNLLLFGELIPLRDPPDTTSEFIS